MRISFKSLLLLLAAAAFLYGCGKKKKKDDANSWGVFENQTNAELTANVYKTREDYFAGTNLYKTFRVPANSSYTLSETGMAPRTLYYVDYYNDDFTLTNWAFPGHAGMEHPYVLHMGQDSVSYFTMKPVYCTARAVLLKDKIMTEWKPVDAYVPHPPFNNEWAFIPDSQKNFTLEIDRRNATVWFYDKTGARMLEEQFDMQGVWPADSLKGFRLVYGGGYLHNISQPVALLDYMAGGYSGTFTASMDTICFSGWTTGGSTYKLVRK